MILAIDDDPTRYDGLRRMFEQRADGAPEFVVASCSVCILAHLPRASAVLLDYDLDSDRDEFLGPLCPHCRENVPDRAKGIEYVPEVAAQGVPVVVVSASYRENVDRLCSKLRGYGVDRLARYSAIEAMPEPHWVAALWVWGVL